ncbi:MAG: RraA family protein [Burkholderiaceae bacterium]
MTTPSPPTTDSRIARLQALYAAAVHDVLRGLGHDDCVLPAALRPLDPTSRLAGPVWTVSGYLDKSRSRHDTLLGWTTVLSRAPGGHIVVCQPNNQQVALMGELSAETLQAKGVLGYVVDGGCRDTQAILDRRFAVFHTFFTPSDIVERWMPDRFGEALTIGSVTLQTGDWLIGDRDGLVAIPQAIVDDVIERTEAVAGTENQVRDAIRAGMDPVDAYLKFGKF